MKKSQRVRLAALTAKDAASLSPDEQAELKQLQALAAVHADASQDVADVAPAATAPTLFGALQGALGSFRDKARISADLATAQSRIATLEQEISNARAETAAITAKFEAQGAQLAAVCGFVGITAADITAKKPEEIQASLAQKVSAAAVEQLAGAGVPAPALPQKTDTTATADTLEEVQAQLAKCTDPKELGRLAARANKLRDEQWASASAGRN